MSPSEDKEGRVMVNTGEDREVLEFQNQLREDFVLLLRSEFPLKLLSLLLLHHGS